MEGPIKKLKNTVLLLFHNKLTFLFSLNDNEMHFYVYILASKKNGTLYTGITNHLIRRVIEHKRKLVKGFTEKYNVHHLVYYEIYDFALDAIAREKQIKRWRREKKIQLIKSINPGWRDLFWDCVGE